MGNPSFAFVPASSSKVSFVNALSRPVGVERASDVQNVGLQMSPGSDNEDDPTKVWYAGIADAVQNVLTNSPLNEGKKALVQMLAGDYDKEAVRAKLDGLIADKNVIMLSFTTWPFCIKAKNILDAKGVAYDVLELNVEEDGQAIRAEMAGVIGRTSVPAVWIGGEFIGGCNDGPFGGIVAMNENGELDSMLSKVGAI
jgi:glutaredoxin 3